MQDRAVHGDLTGSRRRGMSGSNWAPGSNTAPSGARRGTATGGPLPGRTRGVPSAQGSVVAGRYRARSVLITVDDGTVPVVVLTQAVALTDEAGAEPPAEDDHDCVRTTLPGAISRGPGVAARPGPLIGPSARPASCVRPRSDRRVCGPPGFPYGRAERAPAARRSCRSRSRSFRVRSASSSSRRSAPSRPGGPVVESRHRQPDHRAQRFDPELGAVSRPARTLTRPPCRAEFLSEKLVANFDLER
jgi:hypothetical protein